MNYRNCRFRERINGGHVIITIRPGQTLNHCQGGPTDEGWSSQATTWRLSADGQTLERDITDDGADCDGRLTRYHDTIADAFRLDNTGWPHWLVIDNSQCDQFAEAMNY